MTDDLETTPDPIPEVDEGDDAPPSEDEFEEDEDNADGEEEY